MDFADFYLADHHFPAFNVADSAITIAAALLIYDFILEIKHKRNSKFSTKSLENSIDQKKS